MKAVKMIAIVNPHVEGSFSKVRSVERPDNVKYCCRNVNVRASKE
jgi:hypothetical protein